MKRIAVLLVVALMVSFAVTADESTVIDFSTLVADFPKDKPTNNQATIMDFSIAAGSSFSEDQKALMVTSLAIGNWEAVLNNSANSTINAKDTFVKPVIVARGNFKDKAVLGVRVRFPAESWNSYVDIRPPFEIPAYMDKTAIDGAGKLSVPQEEAGRGAKFDGYGVVKNVGVLKNISVSVFGNNFPHRLTIVMADANGLENEYVLGYLSFDGWRTLTWENPNYVTDVRDREMRVYPLYPTNMPAVKLSYFRIYKDASMAGGDYVGYIRDVKIVYDKALLQMDRDIDDEAAWSILMDREEARRNAELRRLGQIQVLRFLETQKMDVPKPADAAAPAAPAAPAAR